MSAAWPFLESGRYGEGAGLREKDRIVLGKPRGSGRHLMLQMPPAQPPPQPSLLQSWVRAVGYEPRGVFHVGLQWLAGLSVAVTHRWNLVTPLL